MKTINFEQVSEYDLRQLNLMREFVLDYEQGNIRIATLIDKLEGLLDCLQSVDIEWKASFCENWLALEESFALALDKQESIECYSQYINEAISNLKKLLGLLN